MMKFLKLPDVKGDPKPFYAILGTGMAVMVLAFTLITGGNEVSSLQDRHDELKSTLAGLDRAIAEKQVAIDAEKNEAIVEVTGLDPKQILSDTDSANRFFAPAFTWTSGSAYDAARDAFIESLGESNSFTKSYMPENTKIDSDDGELNYIDFKEIKSYMDGLVIVPMTMDEGRIRYVGIVNYYVYKDAQDLNNLSVLAPSSAIIEFTVADTDGNRTVSEVEGRAGFSGTLE